MSRLSGEKQGVRYASATRIVVPVFEFRQVFVQIGTKTTNSSQNCDIFNSFETFPSTLVNMDFADYPDAISKPLAVKDSDGQEIKLSFSIQYKLK